MPKVWLSFWEGPLGIGPPLKQKGLSGLVFARVENVQLWAGPGSVVTDPSSAPTLRSSLNLRAGAMLQPQSWGSTSGALGVTSQRDEGTALLTNSIGHHEGSAMLPAAWGQLSHWRLTDCCCHQIHRAPGCWCVPGASQNLVWIQSLPSQRTMAEEEPRRSKCPQGSPF